MKDLCLDTISHDLLISNYDLSLVTDKDYLVQKIKIRLLFIYGEWFLDIEDGLKYYEIIWVKNPNIALIESAIQATILDIEGVINITQFSTSFSNANRELTINATINTIYGTISLEEVL
jgi:uncharacterized membrane protein (Fun14 family)